MIRTFATFATGPRPVCRSGSPDTSSVKPRAKTGPAVSADQSRERYAINALGFVTNLVLPDHRFSAGIKFFEEFANRAAYQGYSFPGVGAFSASDSFLKTAPSAAAEEPRSR